MSAFYAALDVSDKTTAVCVIDSDGALVAESSVETSPAAIALFLKPYRRTLERVGQESGTKAPWLHKELVRKKFPMVCLDARMAHALLSTQRNKTDKNDARALARLVRNGWSSQSYIKSDEAFRWRMLLTHRRILKRKALSIELSLRDALKLIGGKVELRGRTQRLKSVKGADPLVLMLATSMLRARNVLMQEAARLDAVAKKIAEADPVCRRLMTIPGVGPDTALTFRAAVDDPHRFKTSRNVAAHFGLTPRRFQSGAVSIMGRITKCGAPSVRSALYNAAFALLHNCKGESQLRAWGLRLLQQKGGNKARVAVARKLAVIMHRIWVTRRDFEASFVRGRHV
jgi:transposase